MNMKDYNIISTELSGRREEGGRYLNNKTLQLMNFNFSVTPCAFRKKLNSSIA